MTYQLGLLILLYLAVNGFEYALRFLNYRHLLSFGLIVPDAFRNLIDENLLKKTRAYTLEHMKFGTVSSLFEDCLLLIFIFGILNFYNSWILSFKLPFILEGLAFFLILVLVKTIINIPFDLYDSFKIENKYGFNNMTVTLWISDFLKGILISAVMMSLLLSAAFWLVLKFPDMWWFAVWLFLFIFTIFMMYISPYVLEPLFNKFTNIDDPEFEGAIKELLEKAGIHVSRVFKMDASKRTNHSNAYFSGIGKTKRIVIYDTLLANLSKDEILAVLAHEAGHWKKKHILKNIIMIELFSLIGIYLAFLALKSNYLTELFMIQQSSFCAKLIILSFIASIVTWPFTPLFNLISRYFEREADDFACNLTGNGNELASALVKLSKDNLSNMHPHPLYWKFHYSHPPVEVRVNYLNAYQKNI